MIHQPPEPRVACAPAPARQHGALVRPAAAVPANKARGVSIIEVLVAVVILGLILPALVGLARTSKKAQVAGNHMEQAAAVGQLVIDSLSLFPASQIPAGTHEYSAAVNGKTYTARWSFTPVGAHGGTVGMTIDWTQGGDQHSVAMQGAVQ